MAHGGCDGGRSNVGLLSFFIFTATIRLLCQITRRKSIWTDGSSGIVTAQVFLLCYVLRGFCGLGDDVLSISIKIFSGLLRIFNIDFLIPHPCES